MNTGRDGIQDGGGVFFRGDPPLIMGSPMALQQGW
jgi:hypothetical protein